jgi:hypothetical protein
LHI